MAARPPTSQEAALARAADYARRWFHRRPTVAELAAVAGISRFHFHRLFTRRFGRTPLRMVAGLQVKHAKALMVRGVPLRDVAARCGFAHQAHFSTRFKQLTAATPARWLRAKKLGRPLTPPAASPARRRPERSA